MKGKIILKSVLCFILAFLLASETVAYANSAPTTTNNESEEALRLINEMVELQMKEDNLTKIQEIEDLLKNMGVQELTYQEAQDLLGEENMAGITDDIMTTASDYPLPPSTSEITFYGLYFNLSDGRRAYQLIATPKVNGTHSACQATDTLSLKHYMKNAAKSVLQTVADTLISTAISSVFGTIGDTSYFFYQLFGGAISANTASTQINAFEATMYTRTVHQFVYLMNSYQEPVYYGSANCVYYSVEMITRYYEGQNLRTLSDNVNGSIIPQEYYTFPEIAIIGNSPVNPAHCFVQVVKYEIDDESALVIYPKCYSYPIQATN